MNNSTSSRDSSYPFNFAPTSTKAAAAMDASNAYCQNVSMASSASHHRGNICNDNVDRSFNHQHVPQQQRQLGSSMTHMHLVHSLLEGSQQNSSAPATASATNDVSAPGTMPGTVSACSNQAAQAFWQSCRFCQQKFYLTTERLIEHEITCPTHLHVQQFLQKQQQNELQHQLQMQQNQLQQQFKVQQQAQTVESSYNLSGTFGSGIGQYTSSNNNPFRQQSNDIQEAQAPPRQCLNSLRHPQQQSNSYAMEQQTSYQKVSAQAASNSHNKLPSNEDPFESAVNNLPTFEPKPLASSVSSNASQNSDHFPLAMSEDEEWLTPLHCFVRQYCVEIFVATPEDVAAPCMGKRNPVRVQQVGIRCPHCSPERVKGKRHAVDMARARENGVVYPSLISRIYNSSINLLQRHLRSCSFVPPEILTRYEELKSSNARSGASKKYWADSAGRLGLVDTPDGIRLDKAAHQAHLKGIDDQRVGGVSSSAGGNMPEAPPLVLPSDKRNTTAFTFHLMSQMQPCVFTEADRLGRRRGLKVGFAGLACRHCFGVYGSGRFFPSSVKTMADASKTLDVIYRHIMKCKNCPRDIKGGLGNLRDFHDSERSKMPFGNQRAFFVKIWGRLHEGSPPPPTAIPRMAPGLVSSTAAATNALIAPSHNDGVNGTKLNATTTPMNSDSLQGLYAMVKRGKDCDKDSAHIKLATQAA